MTLLGDGGTAPKYMVQNMAVKSKTSKRLKSIDTEAPYMLPCFLLPLMERQLLGSVP